MQILPTNGEIILGNNVQLAFTQAPLDSAGCPEVGGGIIQYIDTSIHSSTYSWVRQGGKVKLGQPMQMINSGQL